MVRKLLSMTSWNDDVHGTHTLVNLELSLQWINIRVSRMIVSQTFAGCLFFEIITHTNLIFCFIDILLSLVRTKAVGHIRDVRRLIVAISRARLGLYIFCRKDLFENCYELGPVFEKLLKRPTQLSLRPNENYPTTRNVSF